MLLLIDTLVAAVVLSFTASVIYVLRDVTFLAVNVCVKGGPCLEGLLLPCGCGGGGG